MWIICYYVQIVFSVKDGIVNESINALNGRIVGGLGSVRGYSTLVGAQSGKKLVLKLCIVTLFCFEKYCFRAFLL